jgi:hypothetical protein
MLRNAPIRTKLLVSLLGPLLVLAVLALVGIRQNQAESQQAGRSTAFARLAAGLAPPGPRAAGRTQPVGQLHRQRPHDLG